MARTQQQQQPQQQQRKMFSSLCSPSPPAAPTGCDYVVLEDVDSDAVVEPADDVGVRTPRSLVQLCRLSIRFRLRLLSGGRSILSRLNRLPLPPRDCCGLSSSSTIDIGVDWQNVVKRRRRTTGPMMAILSVLGADLAAGAAVYSVGGVALSTFGVVRAGSPSDDRAQPSLCRRRLASPEPAAAATRRQRTISELFVGNLAPKSTNEDLVRIFSDNSAICVNIFDAGANCFIATVIRDEDGQSKRYGFITFKSRSSHVLKGKRLRFEMPKRSREEVSAPAAGCFILVGDFNAEDIAGVLRQFRFLRSCLRQQVVSPEQKQSVPAGLEQSSSDQLPLWLHLRLMSDKEQLILCLRKELG
uniref:RRM domain-containing protein n=1 Tax=Macrostomum lignano TaxID=282301 RepID=A0A1I8FJA9_9PLAT